MPEGNGNGDGKGAEGEVQQQLTDALAKVTAAETDNKTLKDAKGDLERKLDEADRELLSEDYLSYKEGKGKGKAAPSKDGNGGSADPNFDIDNATNAQLVEHIQSGSKGNLDAAVKELSSRIEKADERVGLALAQVDISLTAMRHPDGSDKEPGFQENFDTIKKIAKSNPEWGAEKCYQQFKLEKIKTDKDKVDADTKKTEDDRKVLTEKGEGVPGSTTQTKDISKEEAGDLAYRKAFGNKDE